MLIADQNTAYIYELFKSFVRCSSSGSVMMIPTANTNSFLCIKNSTEMYKYQDTHFKCFVRSKSSLLHTHVVTSRKGMTLNIDHDSNIYVYISSHNVIQLKGKKQQTKIIRK